MVTTSGMSGYSDIHQTRADVTEAIVNLGLKKIEHTGHGRDIGFDISFPSAAIQPATLTRRSIRWTIVDGAGIDARETLMAKAMEPLDSIALRSAREIASREIASLRRLACDRTGSARPYIKAMEPLNSVALKSAREIAAKEIASWLRFSKPRQRRQWVHLNSRQIVT